MFSVFIPRFPARASRVPHCNRSQLIAFIVLTGFRNRKLMDGASLSPVYFVSACFLPGHLSVCSAFICHSTYDSVFLTAYFFYLLYSHPYILFFFLIIFCSSTWLSFCRNGLSLVPLDVLYLFLIVLFRDYRLYGFYSCHVSESYSFFFPKRCARVTTFSSSLSRVIDRQRKLRAANGEIRRLRERNYDVRGDNPFSPQLLTVNF